MAQDETIDYGVVVAVTVEPHGSELTVAAAAGATSLTLLDLVDFPETGGQLVVNGEVVTYTSADDETGVVQLATPLVGAHAVEDRVDLYPPSQDVYADVQVGDGDPIPALVPDTVTPLLQEGTFDVGDGPPATVRRPAGSSLWELVRLDGPPPAIDGTYLLPGTVQADSFQAGDLSPGGVLDENGLRAFDAAGVQTFDLSFLDGDFTAVGTLSTGEAPAQRVEIGPATAYPDRNEVRFFTGGGTETAPGRIFHGEDGGRPRFRIEPGTNSNTTDRPSILMYSGTAADDSLITFNVDVFSLATSTDLRLSTFGSALFRSTTQATSVGGSFGVDVTYMRNGTVGTGEFRDSVRTAAAPTLCTAATRPATPYTGQLIYETDTTRTLIYDGTAWKLVARETFPRAHVYLNADVNRTNGGNAVLVLAGANNTFEGGFSRSGSELVFPEAGYYDIYAQIAVDGIGAAGATGSFQTSLRKNAAGSISGGTEIAQDYAPAGGAGKRSGQMTLISQLMAANDTVELFPLNNTGVTATCLSGKTHTLLQAALRS